MHEHPTAPAQLQQPHGDLPDGSPRTLAQPSSRWLGDKGEADPMVRDMLARAVRHEPDPQTAYLRGVAALGGARLLMPIVASGDESMEGPDPDRHAEMAAVSIENAEGERALLAFTGMDALQTWNKSARPVPGTLDDVAATVVEARAQALLIDVAGPVPFIIEDDLVAELAQGRRLVELEDGGFGWMYVESHDEEATRH